MTGASASGPFGERRTRVARATGGVGVVFAGEPVARNYPANPYPYRASSHFLYLTGCALPGGVLVFEEASATLYLPTPPSDDALWHGAPPDPNALEARTGAEVRPLEALPADLRVRAAASLPAPCERSRRASLALLGREVTLENLSGAGDGPFAGDLRLARAMVAARLVHDAHAVRELVRAADATVDAHQRGLRATRASVREWHVLAAMEQAFTERGFTHAYGPIVTTHGEVLHHHGHDGVLADGDLLLADVGAESAGGFAGDVTRTWPVSGRFSATQRALYDVVLGAQRAAIGAVRPGARYRDVHLTAATALAEGLVSVGILAGDPKELVADGVHALFFPHGIGHLLGLDVHDMEDLGDLAGYAEGRTRAAAFGLSYLRLDRDLTPGMAVTIEPGFYQVPALLAHPDLRERAGDRVRWTELAKFADVRGIRIEDDVLVTEDGARVLTEALPRDAHAIEAEVRG